MKFKKFVEIENVRRAKTLELAEALEYHGKWQVTEKIHGSNLGILAGKEDGSISFATRNGVLAEGQNHYNHEHVVLEKIGLGSYFPESGKWHIADKFLDAVKEVIGERFDKYHSFCIFGEIFGGMYNSPNVEKKPKASRCQKGIYYSPDNEFMAFDIMMLRDLYHEEIQNYEQKLADWKETLARTADEVRRGEINNIINGLSKRLNMPKGDYMNVEECKKVCNLAGIPLVPELKICDTLSEALAMDPVFESEVYKSFGLPKIPENYAEGYVIRPLEEIQYPNGDRVILKCKNPKYDEIKKNTKANSEKPEIVCSEKTKALCEKVAEYINTNRLDAVISKMAGPFSHKSFGIIIKEFNADVEKDFVKDFEAEVAEVKALGEYKILQHAISDGNCSLLKSQILNIIDYGHTV